jgi:PAS domain S-box-containing protein
VARYHEVFEKIPDGVTIHDAADGAILDTNQQFCELLGYTREELLSLDFDDLHVDEPPYTSERAEAYIRKAAADGPQTFEWVDETKAGDPLPVEVTLSRTTIEGEERVLAVVRDITERKRRERELERKNERLETFASVVSHDLRNPLNVIEGRLELAREECDSEDLDAIARATDRMDELIENLLTLAREGEPAVEREPVELADTVETCWQNVETDEASLVVETDRTVDAAPSRLRQLLENLARNAVKYGGERVTVTVGDLPDGFYVEDDGPGVPDDQQARLFEPGFTTAETGTGFGLSIVKEIAEAHGWTVRVTDGDAGGARFEITGIDAS